MPVYFWENLDPELVLDLVFFFSLNDALVILNEIEISASCSYRRFGVS
jgi:hypothetical protein